VYVNFAEPIEIPRGMKPEEIARITKERIIEEHVITTPQMMREIFRGRSNRIKPKLKAYYGNFIEHAKEKNFKISKTMAEGHMSEILEEGLKYYIKIGAIIERLNSQAHKKFIVNEEKRHILDLNAAYIKELIY